MTWQPTCANTADIIHLARVEYPVHTCNTQWFSVQSGLKRYTSNDQLHGLEAYCRFQLTEKGCPGPGTTAIRTPALIEPLSRGNGRPMSGIRPWTSRAISTVGFEYDHHFLHRRSYLCSQNPPVSRSPQNPYSQRTLFGHSSLWHAERVGSHII